MIRLRDAGPDSASLDMHEIERAVPRYLLSMGPLYIAIHLALCVVNHSLILCPNIVSFTKSISSSAVFSLCCIFAYNSCSLRSCTMADTGRYSTGRTSNVCTQQCLEITSVAISNSQTATDVTPPASLAQFQTQMAKLASANRGAHRACEGSLTWLFQNIDLGHNITSYIQILATAHVTFKSEPLNRRRSCYA